MNLRQVLSFKRLFKKEDITKRNLLSDVLVSTNNDYQTERLYNIQRQQLYSQKIMSSNLLSGKYSLLTFSTIFLNDKYTEKGYNDKSIKFFFDTIFNPNVKENKFNEKVFIEKYNSLNELIETFEENTSSYSLVRLLEEMDKKNIYGVRTTGYIEDLEKIDNENLYKYYESVLKKDIVDIYVIGDVDENDIIEKIKNNFKINTIKKEGISHFIKHDKFRKTIKVKKEQKDVSQSKLLLGFKLDELSSFERQYVTYIYSYILGGSTDSKLFKTVREKNSLCYYISAGVMRLENIMIISLGIDKNNYKKAISLIKKEVKNMQEGNFLDDEINNGKTTYKCGIKAIYDNQDNIVSTYMTNNYLGYDSIEEKIKNIDKVTKESIINFSKKIHLDTIYFLEGENND